MMPQNMGYIQGDITTDLQTIQSDLGISSVWLSYFKNLGSVKLTIKINQTEGSDKKNEFFVIKETRYLQNKGEQKDKAKKLR